MLARLSSSTFVALAAIALAVVFAAWINIEAGWASERVTHSASVTAGAELVLGQLRDAETGQRGYLLTNDEKYLEPYDSALGAIGGSIKALEALVIDHPAQAELAAQVGTLAAARLDLLAQGIAKQRAGNHQAALDVIMSDAGKGVMDKIRTTISAIKDNETVSLAEQTRAEMTARLINTVAVLVALAGLIYLGWRQVLMGGAENTSLRGANAELERLVAERTAAIEAERERVEMLLKDVNHRIGNNLALVSAILQSQRRRSGDPTVAAALASAQDRVQAIASAHRRLNLDLAVDTVAARPYFENVIGEIAEGVADRDITFDLSLSDVSLPGRDAVYYVIIVNELVTNAIKHAFPDNITGRIGVMLMEDTSRPDHLVLLVEDDGVGRPLQAGSSPGLGGTILDGAVQTLKGVMTVEDGDPADPRRGLRTRVVAPRGLTAGSPGGTASNSSS